MSKNLYCPTPSPKRRGLSTRVLRALDPPKGFALWILWSFLPYPIIPIDKIHKLGQFQILNANAVPDCFGKRMELGGDC